MSHFVQIRTKLREVAPLLQALHNMGFKEVECHDEPQPLFGYRGDERPETAEVIIRRRFIGSASNDVGFKRQPSGEFEAIISEFDRRSRCNESWLRQLNQQYAYRVVLEEAKEKDMIVEQDEVLGNGDRVILLSERG